MISVDTNVLVRIITNDHPKQAKLAAAVLEKERVFISTTVLLEMEWVLRYAYEAKRETILKAFRSILGLPNVETEDALCIARALKWYEGGMDFADALHLASSLNANKFITFDVRLYKKSKEIKEISVSCL